MYDFETPRSTFQFVSPRRIVMGENSITSLGQIVKSYKVGKALLVTDKVLRELGALDPAIESLYLAGIEFDIFDDVEPNPTIANVEFGIEMAKKEAFDIVIGIGGGSPLDVAKGISLMATNPGKVNDYLGMFLPVPEKPLPLILVPTTAGTGSELSFGAVFSDHEAHKKTQIYNYEVIPLVAFIDPIMMMGCPSKLTAASGFDALVHAIESYVTKNSNPYSEALAAQAIRLISKGLVPATKDGKNMKARTQMALGSTFAGMAMSASGLGINHALAYPLTTHHNVPHGTANAVFMPYTMTFNAEEVPEKYANVAELMGLETSGLSPKKASLKAIEEILRFLDELGIPKNIKEFGIKEDELFGFAEIIIRDYVPLCMFNPRCMGPFEAYELYLNALNGDHIWTTKLGN